MRTSSDRPVWSVLGRWTVAVAGGMTCAVFLVLLLSLRHVDGVPLVIPGLLLGLVALSALAPGVALTVLAAAVPVAGWTGRWLNAAVAWPEVLVVAFAAGYFARSCWTGRTRADALRPPILAFTALVLASLAVSFLGSYWTVGGAALWQHVSRIASYDYFTRPGGFRDLDAAMRLIQGMVLLRAASTTAQETPSFAPRLARTFVAGATGAAALNLWRLWQGAQRAEDPIPTFLQYLMTLRYNVHYVDVNAAGSYFVMALLVTAGLCIATRRAHWAVCAVTIAPSLLLSGSRAALVAGAIAVLVWVSWRVKRTLTGRQKRSWILAAAAIALLAAVTSVVLYLSMARNLTPYSTALDIRVEFARTTFRMVEAHPIFGVGIGQYWDRSSSYSSQLLRNYDMDRENAHNNFFQILGELGVLGLVGLLWILWTAGRASLRPSAQTPAPLHEGITTGLLAFVLTWLSGHPLLIDEPALLFWTLLGTAAGLPRSARPGVGTATRFTAGAAGAILTLALAVTVPSRASIAIANAGVERRGIGLSPWQQDDTGKRYQLAGARSTLFIPSGARVVTLPLRPARPGEELLVVLELNGRAADVVRVAPGAWSNVRLIVPSDLAAPRFLPLELRVIDAAPGSGELLLIGEPGLR